MKLPNDSIEDCSSSVWRWSPRPFVLHWSSFFPSVMPWPDWKGDRSGNVCAPPVCRLYGFSTAECSESSRASKSSKRRQWNSLSPWECCPQKLPRLQVRHGWLGLSRESSWIGGRLACCHHACYRPPRLWTGLWCHHQFRSKLSQWGRPPRGILFSRVEWSAWDSKCMAVHMIWLIHELMNMTSMP